MREIKFRAWDVERGKYRFGTDNLMMDLSGRLYWQFGYLEPEMLSKDSPFVVEQFTGIQDANGVDIYEGDIVRHDDYSRGAIIAFSGADVQPKHISVIKIKDFFNGIQLRGLPRYCANEITVIGNIHEHSHLLEES